MSPTATATGRPAVQTSSQPATQGSGQPAPVDDVMGYLRSKGLQVFAAAGRELTCHCFFLCEQGHGGAKGKGKLYVNSETWLFSCKVCGTSGGRKMLMERFGDVDERTWTPGSDPGARMRALTEYTDYAADLLLGNTKQLTYLTGRGLNAATIVAYKLGWAPRGMSITSSLPGEHKLADLEATGLVRDGRDFHQGKITIPYLSRGQALQVRGKDPQGKYFTPAGDQVRLFNADVLPGAEYVILVEGEFDALILQQVLRASPNVMHHRFAVVAVPGTSSFPGGTEGFADYFRDAKRVYIAFDADDAGRTGAAKAKELIGSKARIVELPDTVLADTAGRVVGLDWTEYLRPLAADHPHGGHGVEDVMALIHTAEMTGKRLFSVAEAHVRWNSDKVSAPGISLGFPSLDAIIAPGLRPGNLCIPMAKTGTGKTVFLANVAYNLRARRVLHITLENTVTEFFELLWRIHHFWEPTSTDSHIGSVMPGLRIFDENRLTEDDLAMLIEEYREDVGEKPELVAIDYLGYFARGQKGNSAYEKTSNAVMLLKAMGKANDVAIICPSQVGRAAKEGVSFEGDKARDSGVVEETGDFLLSLYRPHESLDAAATLVPGQARAEMEAQILKSRRGGKGKIAKLMMSPASLVVADATNRVAAARINQEVEAYNRGASYAEIAAAQREAAHRRAQTSLAIVA